MYFAAKRTSDSVSGDKIIHRGVQQKEQSIMEHSSDEVFRLHCSAGWLQKAYIDDRR